MAGITQTIPSFIGGISEQPDNLKFPGQLKDLTNAIPDVTRGLFKRPGADRVGTSPLSGVQSEGSWFHYYRDEEEGAYIGQVATGSGSSATGQIRIWSCKTGQAQTVVFGDGSAGDLVDLLPYLQTTKPENLQFLTINDTTFINNRDSSNYTQAEVDDGVAPLNVSAGSPRTATAVGTTGTTDSAPHRNYAFVELLRSANGRQYGLNIKRSTNTTTTTLQRATRIKIVSDSLLEGDHTGHCPSIGTQVFSVNSADTFNNGLIDSTVNNSNYMKWTFDMNSSPQTGFNNITTNASSTYVRLNYNHVHGFPYGQALVYDKGENENPYPGLVHGHVYFASYLEGLYGIYLAVNRDKALAGTTEVSLTHPNAQTGRAKDWFIPLEHYQYVRTFNAIGGTRTKTVFGNPTDGHSADTSKTNLTFRLTILGQQGVAPNSSGSSPVYRCSYQREAILLHGGEGWKTGDQAIVALDTAQDKPATFTVEVMEHEDTVVNATIAANNPGDGLIRPAPTPFDADTAVTADTILGGIKGALAGTGINADIIGTGIYFYTNDASDPANDIKFSVEIVEDDLMRVMHTSVNDVTNLPNQCKHGYIVQVSNSRMADEDDYYLVFNGTHGRDGSGSWSECANQGIAKSLTNMPLVVQRTAYDSSNQIATFTVKRFEYEGRRVGDDKTNPFPSFVQTSDGLPKSSNNSFIGRINKVLFFRNRLAFLSGENVILSRPGTLGKPDFFIESALTVSASDPIDISAASMFPSELFDGIETTSGLLVFSTNQQFLLAADDTVLNPDTAKMRSVSTFNYNKTIPPISLGTTIGYVDNSGKFSRFNEMANIRREGEPNVVEVSKVVPSLLPKNIDLLTNSRENGIVLMSQTATDDSAGIVFGYKYFQVAEQRQQASWFKWKFNKGLLYHFIIDDEYFFLDKDKILQKIRLIKSDDDPTATDENAINYLLHLDNHTTINGGVFSNTSNTTTFSGVGWLSNIQNSNYDVAIIDSTGRYTKPTVSGTTLTLVGDWTNSTLPSGQTHFTVGYVYDYEVQFPTLYPFKVSGNKATADVNSSLVLHRLKFHFGKVGTYKTSLKRVGKPTYEDQHESILASEYEAGKVPYLPEFIKTVPVYERNTNVDITLRSTHPSPATLHALSWEGDYSPRFYSRV